MSRLFFLGGISAHMVLLPGLWNLVYHKGAAAELLGGTLKLRYCNTIFTKRFPPWSSPRVGNGGGKRCGVLVTQESGSG